MAPSAVPQGTKKTHRHNTTQPAESAPEFQKIEMDCDLQQCRLRHRINVTVALLLIDFQSLIHSACPEEEEE